MMEGVSKQKYWATFAGVFAALLVVLLVVLSGIGQLFAHDPVTPVLVLVAGLYALVYGHPLFTKPCGEFVCEATLLGFFIIIVNLAIVLGILWYITKMITNYLINRS